MKKNIVIVILSIVILIMGIGYVVLLSDDKTNSGNKNNDKVEVTKNEYYTKMLSKMDTYYKIYFRNINLKGQDGTKSLRISLKNLKTYGFPIDEFVSFDNKESCDLDQTYAVRTLKDKKFNIKLYYKCGEDSNYKINNNVTKKTS